MLFPISIGRHCRPRYQIDRFMLKHVPDYRPTAFFFDWLNGSLSGVINMIERDFSLRREDIVVREWKGRYEPSDRASGLTFPHDFGCRGRKWEDAAACETALRLAMGGSLLKYAYLGRRTRDALETRTDVALIYYGEETRENFERLAATLQRRYGRTFVLVNVLDIHRHTPAHVDGSVINLFVDDSGSDTLGTLDAWQGCEESWSRALGTVLL